MTEDFEPMGSPPPEEASNRTFVIAIAALAGLFIVGLLCIGAYAFLIGPQVTSRRQAAAATAVAQNTARAMEITQTAQAARFNPNATATVPATATLTASPVVRPSDTPTSTPTSTPTPGPSPTSTPTRTPTAVGAQPTALPETGFADEAGVPSMLMGSLVLIAVLVVVRRLRLSGVE